MTTTTPAASTPATSTTGATASSPPDALSQLSSNFGTFLTLLTSQLKNQDPTAPMDSNQFTQQLVQFSQVEQQINTNANLKTLITQGASQSGTFATSYLGKKVSVTNGNASLSGGQADWSYDLKTTATVTALTVTDANGNVVYSGAGETASGNHDFSWNGTDNNGNKVSDGTYTLSVSAKALDGSTVTSSVASAGTVTQIDMTGGTPQLVIGNMEVSLADIAAITN
ncbi:MAG TPA: flagellar hook assembly protein FlgD [Rhizomicrobium sp.]|jgi:flagellar basal-body rod modification protein FlgD|nr:flagellar hook assembly protein FlgD [Rhizomicrobium sp.]